MVEAAQNRSKRWSKPRYVPRRKVCLFCRDKIEDINYKDLVHLKPYVSDRGKIEPRRKTGTCARHQRRVSEAIKRARYLVLLPYVPAHVRKTGGAGLRG